MRMAVVTTSNKRVAVIHEWLTDWGGSEAVTTAILEAYPAAHLHALFNHLSLRDLERLQNRPITTTFLQLLPGMRKHFWYWLWLMPYAVEKLDMRQHDIILSSSHAFAKGVLTSAEQFHVSYVHSPMRYAWDLYHDYLEDYGLTRGIKGTLAHVMFHHLRQWDRSTANNVDLFLANSAYVARRIWRAYRRPAVVLHPPVDVERIPFAADKEDFYLTVSRLVSYKRVDLIVQAFAKMPQRRLVVIGDGPESAHLRAMNLPNVSFLGYQPDDIVHDHLVRARAFLFAAIEDFGITPVEAQAAGTPVIAYGRGGALETVCGLDGKNPPTGLFFDQQDATFLSAAIERFEACGNEISAQACRDNAMNFTRVRFIERFGSLVENGYAAWRYGETLNNHPDCL